MEPRLTIDDVARTPDETVVRQRFDQRNRVVLTILLVIFAFVSLIELTTDLHRKNPLDLAIAFSNLVLVGLGAFVMRDVYRLKRASDRPGNWGVARWVRGHLTATLITYLTLQYALVLAFTRDGSNWVAWAIITPLFVLGVRMMPSEVILLHAILLAGGLAMAIGGVRPEKQSNVPFFVSVVVMNVSAAAVELYFSRRMRNAVVTEWTERRTQAREQIRMRDELRYARELQLSMLPDCAPSLDWLDICAISVPATEVGGDYYDYFLDDNTVALVCGDVAGHGMPAGLVLAAVRSGFTLLRDSLVDPAGVLQRLHDLVQQTSRRRMLVTVAVVLLDRAAKKATIASAGHPPILVRRADGTVETIDLFAPPLGVRLPLAVPQRQIDIAAGDVIVLHSDGVYEARNSADESYGIERLAGLLAEIPPDSAESFRNAILRDVAAFRGSLEQQDDVTVVVARVR